MTGVRRKPAVRKPTRDSAERDWLIADKRNVEAERRKFEVEVQVLQEQLAEIEYERDWRRAGARDQRVYDFTGEVTTESAADTIATLSEWATRSADPILLRIMSPGGDVPEGLAVYDFVMGLRASGVVVNTLTLGWGASMASVLMQCGETRYIGTNASVLIHEGRETGPDYLERISDIVVRAEFMKSLDLRCDLIVAERSRLSLEELRERYIGKPDWWLTAPEAVALRFADELWSPKRGEEE